MTQIKIEQPRIEETEIPMNEKQSPRSLALTILEEVRRDDRYANISLKEHLRSNNLDERDTAFVSRLVYGTLEKQITIDCLLEKLAKMNRVKPLVRNILRLGAYQILYMDRVPDSAACNEAVNLCKRHGYFPLKGFVNGTLRNLSRRKQDLLVVDPQMSKAEQLSFQYSFPLWLTEKWVSDYGQEKAEAIMKPMEDNDGVSLRVNAGKTTPANLKAELAKAGAEPRNGTHMSEAIRLTGMGDPERNPRYQQGHFTVQGESSMLTSHVVDPQPGEVILDACSSPGGKATHMSELMGGVGRVLAWELHPHRLELVKQNQKRMDAKILEPMQMDASVFDPRWEGVFDRVLIDAPCSGLGILHKKPDIMHKVNPKDLKELPLLQMKLLAACSAYVKPGGVLVYSTCTINPGENQQVIQAFLTGHQEFTLEDPSHWLPSTVRDALEEDGTIQLIPSLHRTDGFFIARMRRSLSQ